ncbi:MAG: hypothetical protein WDA22_05075 [Bacteroidota bacterium]
MGLGQTMLTLGFLVLLTVAVIGIYTMVVDKDTGFYQKEAFEQAGVLAGALLDEIEGKKFDDVIIITGRPNEIIDTSDTGLPDPTDFTSAGNLGPDAIWSTFFGIPYISGYESSNVPLPDSLTASVTRYRSVSNSHNRYDDVDDYNGYIRAATSGSLSGFRLWVNVYYVDSSVVYSSSQTYLKKIDVSVMNWHYLTDTLSFSKVISF